MLYVRDLSQRMERKGQFSEKGKSGRRRDEINREYRKSAGNLW
jgi:hypothetical protein